MLPVDPAEVGDLGLLQSSAGEEEYKTGWKDEQIEVENGFYLLRICTDEASNRKHPVILEKAGINNPIPLVDEIYNCECSNQVGAYVNWLLELHKTHRDHQQVCNQHTDIPKCEDGLRDGCK
jgi:hypothetical protein